MKFSIGFSPCPNDTFIFYALIHGKVEPAGFEYELVIEDVEQLNQRAYRRDLDITKISFNAYLDLTDQYILLESGAALGRNCGPLLISKKPVRISELQGKTIAIPGEKTTANFLLDYYLGASPGVRKEVHLFSEIENLLLNEKVDAGVIIHENRFTYGAKGLQLIRDLGTHWEENTAHPIPLGGIIARRDLSQQDLRLLSDAIRDSIRYAWDHPKEVLAFVKDYAQEMDESVMRQHIDLYVNDFTSSLGSSGRQAIHYFFETAYQQQRILKMPTLPILL